MTSMKSLGWIGEFPASWEVMPNKALIRKKKVSVGSKADEYPLLSLTKGGVIVRNLDEGGKFPENFDSYQQVSVGDLVTCLFDVPETPRTIGLSPHNGMITGAYDVFEFTERVNPRYFEYYYLALDDRKGLSYFYSGLRNVIRTPVFLSIPMPVPPIDEQKAIADFLDRELAQIDALIEKQNLLVTAAKSRMAALIESQIWANAGSDGTSAQSVRFGAYVSLISEKSEHDNAVFLDQIESWTGRRTLVEVELDNTEASSIGMKFRPGDVLFGKLRPYLAKVWLADSEGVAFGDIYVLRSKVLTSEYVKYLLLSERVIGLIDSTSYGTKMPRANWDAIKTIRIPLPDENKQREIVTKLDAQSVWTSQAIEKLHSLNRDLVERRQSLISAAVTGKIDTRKVA